jgi:glycosyltransferase involved in cell wall biosynthesis
VRVSRQVILLNSALLRSEDSPDMTEAPKRSWRIVHSESEIGWGGQEHRILAELRGFQRRGADVCLLASPHSGVYQRAVAAGIPVHFLSASKLRFPWMVAQTTQWLRRSRVQILNTHSSRDAWIVGLAGRLAKVPFILRTRHFDVAIPNRRLSRYVYEKLADHLLTTSPRVSSHFQEFFGWPPERVTTLPTGIDLEVFSPTGPAAKLVDESDGQPLVGMVSVLRSAKGHNIWLQAVRRLRDANFKARYVIVGDGPVRQKVQDQIKELQLEDCVRMLGHRDDVPEVLRALDLLVIPSRQEGIPQVGLQALATQTPTVGSDVGGIPSIIHHGETGRLVPPENPEALAQAMREALEQGEITRAMAERGRAFVETHYDLDTMLDILEALYRRRFHA